MIWNTYGELLGFVAQNQKKAQWDRARRHGHVRPKKRQ